MSEAKVEAKVKVAEPMVSLTLAEYESLRRGIPPTVEPVQYIDWLHCGTMEYPIHDGMGYVRLVGMMPSTTPLDRTPDQVIVDAARVSYKNRSTKSVTEDMALLRHLMESRHTSPFEMIELKFEVKTCITAMRQLVRHRTASLNELSMRYTVAPDEFYFPKPRMQGSQKHSVSDDGTIPAAVEAKWEEAKAAIHKLHKELYKELCDMGMAREVARMILPGATMTTVVWKQDGHNLMHMMRLRCAPDAQLEVREIADAMYKLFSERFPITAKAFADFQTGSVSFSVPEQDQLSGRAAFDSKRPDKKKATLAKAARLGLVPSA